MNYQKLFFFIQNREGQSLVELLVTIGIAAILMPAFLVGFSATRQGRAQQGQRLHAIGYLREAAEAVRIIRDNGWASFSTNGTYCPQPVSGGSTWELKSFPQHSLCDTPASGYTRRVIIDDVYRNTTTHAIDPSGSSPSTTLDPSSKSVTVSVGWSTPISSEVSQVMYVTRHENLSYLDTTVADFNAGTRTGTAVTNMIGGEIMLGGTGASDWCNPNSSGIVKYSLTGNGSWTAISAVAATTTTPGHAYTTFGFNQSGNPLDSVNVSNPSSGSPVITAGSSFTADNIKTYSLFADPSSTYVFLTSNSNQKQVDVVNTTNFSSSIASFKSSGGEAGQSVYVATIGGTKTGFLTTSGTTKLYSFTVGNAPSGSLTQLGSVNLAGTGNRVVVVGNYAFIATASTTSPLQIVNVSNPSSMNLVTFTNGFSIGSLQGASPKGAVDLSVDSTGRYVFLATSYVDSSHPDVFMIDVGTPTAPVISSSGNTFRSGAGMSPIGIIPVSGNHMIVVGSGGDEYQVFWTQPSISNCGGFSLVAPGTKISGVAGVSESDGDNFAYILTDDSTGYFQVVPGGAGGSGGAVGGSGTFVSQGIPVSALTSSATFNSFFPIADVPSVTSISYQVGVAPTCASAFTFIGPDGTSASTYATASAIPLTGPSGYANPGKCFKYKVNMSSSSNNFTPILYQVNVNYSP